MSKDSKLLNELVYIETRVYTATLSAKIADFVRTLGIEVFEISNNDRSSNIITYIEDNRVDITITDCGEQDNE